MVIVSDNVENKDWIPSSSTSYLEQSIGMPLRRKNQESIGGELDQSFAPTRMMKRIPDPSSYSPQTLNSISTTKLHEMIVRMKIWESAPALIIHFKKRYGIIDAEYLAKDPTWSKVMQVRSELIWEPQFISFIKVMQSDWILVFQTGASLFRMARFFTLSTVRNMFFFSNLVLHYQKRWISDNWAWGRSKWCWSLFWSAQSQA